MKSMFLSLILLIATGNAALAEIVVAWAGQSLCSNMFTDNSVYIAPATNTYQWNSASSSWETVQGAPAREYANMLNAQTGQSIYMITACSGGSALLAASAVPPGSNHHWTSTASDSPLTWLVNQVNASGKKPNILNWNGGQAEYTSSDPNIYGNYYNGLAWLYSYLLSQWGLTSSQMSMSVWISGRANYGTSQNVNAAQLSFATSYPGARLGPAYYDLTYDTDQTHLVGWPNITMADRGARNDLKALGVSGFSCAGTPRIVGGWMVTNQLIELITDSYCGLHTHSWATTLTGWTVYDSSWNVVPVSSAWLSGSSGWWGTSIYLYLSWSVNPRPYVFYWINQYQNPAAPSFANDTSLGINGNPIAPLPYGIQMPN